MVKKGWDDEAFKTAKSMYKDGDSAGVIEIALRKNGYNLSRSAIIGKLFRSKIVGGAIPLRPTKRVVKEPVARKSFRATPLPPLPPRQDELLIQYIGPVGSFPPKGACRYTRDDPKKKDGEGNVIFQMCGRPVYHIERHWCAEHAAICFTPIRKKPEENAA